MHVLVSILQWFSGGAGQQYHNLRHCMNGDLLWISLTVTLDVSVAAGYLVIAYHWFRNERLLPPSPARAAMSAIRNIFIFCGICGYVFIPIKIWWPAWRLYDIAMAALVFYTWRYAFSAMDLKVVYNELGRTRKLAEELEASQADVKRRSDFLNAISHDLRTPLNGLTLRASLAEVQLAKQDKAALEKSLADIRASAHGVAQMLDQLLDYARLDRDEQELELADFPLAELCGEVAHDCRPSAEEKGITVESNVPRDVGVRTDRLKLRRILGNLVGNAVKFTSRGGVRLEAEWSGSDLEIHVIDTGIGIAQESGDAIFEEFVQLGNDQRDRKRGFGLGLPIARQLCRKLGGEIQLESSLGTGSRFTVVLPGVVSSTSTARSRGWRLVRSAASADTVATPPQAVGSAALARGAGSGV